jgi:hypothetical protein
MDANDRLSYFCETYLECRNQFLKSSDELIRKLPSNYQSKVERGQWKIPSRTDDQLITDWIYLPAEKTTQNLILITSATHGVEGFMGSTVQKYLLTEVFPTFDREKTGVILVHAINPYGFKYFRRVTENNIDLNRNFDTTKEIFQTKNEGYRTLEESLNPTGKAGYSFFAHLWFLVRMTRLLLTEKLTTLRKIISI